MLSWLARCAASSHRSESDCRPFRLPCVDTDARHYGGEGEGAECLLAALLVDATSAGRSLLLYRACGRATESPRSN